MLRLRSIAQITNFFALLHFSNFQYSGAQCESRGLKSPWGYGFLVEVASLMQFGRG